MSRLSFSFYTHDSQNQLKINQMKNQVVVTGDAAGNVIVTSKNNPEYGFIRVEQSRMLVDDRGWARKKTVSSLIPGKVEDLKGFEWSAGEMVSGKVVVNESLKPFNEQEPDRDLKIAGETGVICTFEGQPIYRKTVFSFETNAADTFVKHDNVDEIRAGQKAYASTLQVEGEDSFN
jgi:hypothetical protein